MSGGSEPAFFTHAEGGSPAGPLGRLNGAQNHQSSAKMLSILCLAFTFWPAWNRLVYKITSKALSGSIFVDFGFIVA